MKMYRLLAIMTAWAAAALAQTAPTAKQIAERLTANHLKADVSFLASDAMQGRGTPSREQDIAAEYIAAQFRRAGLEPAGDDGYFQTAAFRSIKPNLKGLELTLDVGGRAFRVGPEWVEVLQPAAADVAGVSAVRVFDAAAATALTPEQTRGKALLIEGPRIRLDIAVLQPAIVISVPAAGPRGGTSRPALVDAAAPGPAAPVVMVWNRAACEALAASKNAEVKVSARVPAPSVKPVKLRNVAGVLRGSDPSLKDTYLVISAHYDHLGVRATGGGDRVYNGANDDASGVATVIEIADALAAHAKPKRSILFLALFGEEVGELGSQYYVRHPIVPIAKTIADINLEQVGRTDSSDGPRRLQFNLTGFDYTTLAPVFQKAAIEAGVRAVKDERNSDSYFARSDNAKFANAGVPSTTISVAYLFPDYHAVGDEWGKIDYQNMAKVDCAIALAAFRLADSAEAPQWNAEDLRTARYRKAREAAKQ